MAYTDTVLVIISESVVCESLLAQLIMVIMVTRGGSSARPQLVNHNLGHDNPESVARVKVFAMFKMVYGTHAE